MSILIEDYEQDDIYIDYEWDKYAPHYVVFVGRKCKDGLVHTIFTNSYATKEQAKRSFRRQVVKAMKGEQ